ncbi:MAG: glycosyltransferase family 4 protein, partial [Planctomycetota bacterium]
ILHAHSSSLLTAVLASALPPHPRVVWHNHFGKKPGLRLATAWWLLSRRAAAVVSASHELKAFARTVLRVPDPWSWYLPNFPAPPPSTSTSQEVALPGIAGRRVVCLANLRAEKNHRGLLAAFESVVATIPDAHLLMVGDDADAQLIGRLQSEAAIRGIEHRVHWLGLRTDVADLLRACDVGVLASDSEGLPLALLEYGQARLPVVATDVGQVRNVMHDGRAGRLVPPGDMDGLAREIVGLLKSAEQRESLGALLQQRVASNFSLEAAVELTHSIYDAVLRSSPLGARRPARVHSS